MKNCILTIVLLQLFSFEVNGQVIYERVYDYSSPSIEYPFILSNKATFSITTYNSTFCQSFGYRVIDTLGNEISVGGLSNESGHSFYTQRIGKDSILISFRDGPHDYPGDNFFKVKLWRPDSVITLVLDTVAYSIGEDEDLLYQGFFLLNNKVVYQKVDSFFVKNITNGVIEKKLVIPLTSQVIPLDSNLVIWADTNKPIVLDAALNQVYSWQGVGQIQGFYPSIHLDSFLIGHYNGLPTKLVAVNAFTEAEIIIDLSSFGSSVDKVRIDDHLLIIQMRTVSGYEVLILDNSFTIVDQYAITLTPELTDLSIYATSVFIYAWRLDGISSYKANYRICYQNDNAEQIHYVNIGWDDMWVDSVYYWPWEMHLPAKVFIFGVVRNFSSDTIHDFVVHFQDKLFAGCDDGVRATFFTGRNIAPGETDTVFFQTYSWELYEGKPFIREYYIQHANYHLDSAIADNQFTVVHFPEELKVIADEDLQVFPNPFTDFIAAASQNNSLELELFDQMGQMVSQGKDQLNDLSELPVGIYFLQIHTGQQILVKKVVKVIEQ